MTLSAYVRFEAVHANARGTRTGVFALSNGLAHDGLLTAADFAAWRVHNDFVNEAYPDPGRADPSLFDRRQSTVCWFRSSATHLLTATTWYLELLDRYHVAWQCTQTADPGRVLYQDAVQVVAAIAPLPGDRTRLGPDSRTT